MFRSTYGAGTYAVLWVWSFSEFALSHVEVYLLLAHYAFGSVADLPVPSGSPLPVRVRPGTASTSLVLPFYDFLQYVYRGQLRSWFRPAGPPPAYPSFVVFLVLFLVSLFSLSTVPPRCVSIKWLDGPSVPLVDSAGASSSSPELSDVSLRSLPVTILTVHLYPCPHVCWFLLGLRKKGGAPH